MAKKPSNAATREFLMESVRSAGTPLTLWGREVIVKPLPLAPALKIKKQSAEDEADAMATLLIASLHSAEDGLPLLSEADRQWAANSLPADIANRIAEIAIGSGVEAAVKN